MLEDPRNVGQAGLGKAVQALSGEDGRAALLDELMHVHSRTGDLVHRLGHERDE